MPGSPSPPPEANQVVAILFEPSGQQLALLSLHRSTRLRHEWVRLTGDRFRSELWVRISARRLTRNWIDAGIHLSLGRRDR